MSQPLPGILAEIEDAAGHHAALDFARKYGAGRLYIPRGTYPSRLGSYWMMTVSPKVVATLQEAYPGETVYIPIIQIKPKATNRFIPHLTQIGLPVSEVARRLGISRSRVKRWDCPNNN